ncbi:preprotein translocase subunit SecE [Croceifilum oryzae]|uniref:Protein translocase subunit SecE n=1 Tax=Croceifilum oryzae TaxID=1553429 RepID=A0AAJ1TNZ0_9BACL|nr:preprotein translocase subunit SecE [Croceifilum oryzae]MDQ0418230.1 preprotein translocase subunit SecE [Croceifilum oryzae]
MTFLANIGRGIKKSVGGTVGFFSGSVQELKRVRWPSRKEMVNYTLVVVSTVVVLTIFLFLVDLGINQVLKLIPKK